MNPHDLHPAYRFAVVFLAGGVLPNTLDIRFQSVSGLSSNISTTPFTEGGENLYSYPLPDRVSYQNLVLTRGFTAGSPLNWEFNIAMTTLKVFPSNVLVSVLNEENMPVMGASWLFQRAIPVRWSSDGLNGDGSNILIDTLELSFARMLRIGG